MKSILYAALLLLAGCANIPKMDGTDGIMAAAVQAKGQPKSGDAGCFKVSGPLGAWSAIMTWMNIDTGVVKNGRASVGENCQLELINKVDK